jgi:hypothetical protein
MTKRWRDIDLLSSPQVKKDLEIIIALEVAVAIERVNTEGEGRCAADLVPLHPALPRPQGAQGHLLLILVLHLLLLKGRKVKLRRNLKRNRRRRSD